MKQNIISQRLIGVLGQIFSDLYTHSQIDGYFLYSDAPGDAPEGNKVQKTIEWLRRTNKQSDDPLSVLGALLEDIMERDLAIEEARRPWEGTGEPCMSTKIETARQKISSALEATALAYKVGGKIVPLGIQTLEKSLLERVSAGDFSAVGLEIDRAAGTIASDPNGAVHYAGNLLEAVFKAYLNRKEIVFDEDKAGMIDLWTAVRDDIGLNPRDLDGKDLKKIASGLHGIVDGTMQVRNKKSGAHGRTEKQTQQNQLRPRHARLVVHSAGVIANYVLDCLSEQDIGRSAVRRASS